MQYRSPDIIVPRKGLRQPREWKRGGYKYKRGGTRCALIQLAKLFALHWWSLRCKFCFLPSTMDYLYLDIDSASWIFSAVDIWGQRERWRIQKRSRLVAVLWMATVGAQDYELKDACQLTESYKAVVSMVVCKIVLFIFFVVNFWGLS